MFAKKQKRNDREAAETQDRFQRNERIGKHIYERIAGLKNAAREDLAHEVFMLFREARHQGELIRQSIKDRTHHEFGAAGIREGDLATYLAGDVAHALRHHVANPQTLLQKMSDRLPEAGFTIHQQDAVSMIAAIIREQRLAGILEGLRLAGVLNEKGKRQGNRDTAEPDEVLPVDPKRS
jgi:hypothetical protein